MITTVEEVSSFFSFFKSYEFDENKINPVTHKQSNEDDEEEDILETIEEEYDLGLFVKNELIPLALEYYLEVI